MKKMTAFLLVAALTLVGCKQEFPKEVKADNVFGTVQKLSERDSVKQVIYSEGEDPSQKHWGLAAVYEVTVNDQVYRLNFDQVDKYKTLAVGDKISLQPSRYIACLGESELHPTCFRLMRVYKTDKRVVFPSL